MVPDFQQFYGIDLLGEIAAGRLSWRRYSLLVNGLPSTSRLHRKLTDGRTEWTTTDYLTASLLDYVAHLVWMTARTNFKDAPKTPPKPVHRPGPQPKRPNQTDLTPAEIHARLVEQRQKEGARGS